MKLLMTIQNLRIRAQIGDYSFITSMHEGTSSFLNGKQVEDETLLQFEQQLESLGFWDVNLHDPKWDNGEKVIITSREQIEDYKHPTQRIAASR